MPQFQGIVTAIAQLGLQAILIKPFRRIGPFTAQVTFEEQHTDDLEITDQPVEFGAHIADHAYKRPAQLTVRCGWSNSPSSSGSGPTAASLAGLVGTGALGNAVATLASPITSAIDGTIAGVNSILSNLAGQSVDQVQDIYEKLLKLQDERIPFSVFTGKRIYDNMLLKSLRTETTKETADSLLITATFQQIIIVSTHVLIKAAPKDAQADPAVTLAPIINGTKNLIPGLAYNALAGAGIGIPNSILSVLP